MMCMIKLCICQPVRIFSEPFAPDELAPSPRVVHHSSFDKLTFFVRLVDSPLCIRPSLPLITVESPELTPFRPPPGKSFLFTAFLPLLKEAVLLEASSLADSPTGSLRFFAPVVPVVYGTGGPNDLSHSLRCNLYMAIVARASVT